MFVYIAHVEADKAAAEDLQAFLKTRGLVVNLEDGSRGFHHLQASDVVIALWSQKSVFGTHRLQMEKRMLDAWADERLVLVKLDHGFLPVGMRDLLSIDASFEQGRKLSVWPAVERAAKEARDKGLAAVQAEREKADSFGGGAGGPGGIDPLDDLLRTRVAPAPQASSPYRKGAAERKMAPAPAAKRGAPLGAILLVLVVVAAGLWFFTLLPNYTAAPPASVPSSTLNPTTGLPEPAPSMPRPEPQNAWPILAAAGVGALALFTLIALLLRGAGKKKTAAAPAPKPAKRAEEALAPAAAAPPPPAPEPAPTALFISYSHADNAQVEPVVKAVQENGRVVWIDKTGIQTGDGWAGEIVRAIKGAKAIIVMCSKHAFESDHVKREVYLADRYKKPLSPVFIEEATPPEDFEYFFASVQWLELWKLPEADRPAAIGKALEAV